MSTATEQKARHQNIILPLMAAKNTLESILTNLQCIEGPDPYTMPADYIQECLSSVAMNLIILKDTYRKVVQK